MPNTRTCPGWPHQYDPVACPLDFTQYKRETRARETRTEEREQARYADHESAERAPAAALPQKAS